MFDCRYSCFVAATAADRCHARAIVEGEDLHQDALADLRPLRLHDDRVRDVDLLVEALFGVPRQLLIDDR